jgi:hypothetical protein
MSLFVLLTPLQTWFMKLSFKVRQSSMVSTSVSVHREMVRLMSFCSRNGQTEDRSFCKSSCRQWRSLSSSHMRFPSSSVSSPENSVARLSPNIRSFLASRPGHDPGKRATRRTKYHDHPSCQPSFGFQRARPCIRRELRRLYSRRRQQCGPSCYLYEFELLHASAAALSVFPS